MRPHSWNWSVGFPVKREWNVLIFHIPLTDGDHKGNQRARQMFISHTQYPLKLHHTSFWVENPRNKWNDPGRFAYAWRGMLKRSMINCSKDSGLAGRPESSTSSSVHPTVLLFTCMLYACTYYVTVDKQTLDHLTNSVNEWKQSTVLRCGFHTRELSFMI